MKRKFHRMFLLLPVLAILILGLIYGIYQSVMYSETFTSFSNFARLVRRCPPTNGPNISSRIVDLDPTIPLDSKASFSISLTNRTSVEILFSNESQVLEYLRELDNFSCFFGNAPPGCMMGHYPGEPPGRKPCTFPTPSTTGIP